MARRLTTNRQIDAFIKKIIREANHHAPAVIQVIMPLSQAVRARLNLAHDRVEVIERLGNLGRTCWVTLGGKRYLFSYSHDDQKINLREGTTQGPLVFQFDKRTTTPSIQKVIGKL